MQFPNLLSIRNNSDFNSTALSVFNYQYQENIIYRNYVDSLRISINLIENYFQIPFLPVEFFKTHEVVTGKKNFQRIFTSSGTTGNESSRHFIHDVSLYEDVFTEIFSSIYGDPSEYVMLALLPSYLEREGSSLIYMMEHLIELTKKNESGFYLHDHEKLFILLNDLKRKNRKTILLGVTYALLDFVNNYEINFPDLIVMETGGMKGKRKEMVREEVHSLLSKGFGVKKIHSEYGMTELLSQAYSKGDGLFNCPPWMKIIIRDAFDPFSLVQGSSSGGINIIDLANIHSCAFISTQDLGKVYDDHKFEVLGRIDFSEMRGCNLLIS